MNEQAVVVTGVGLLSALGDTPEACFDAICRGRVATEFVPESLAGGSTLLGAGLLRGFNGASVVGEREVKRTPRFAQFALAAARRARADARMERGTQDPTRVGCILGSALAGLESLQDAAVGFKRNGVRGVTPFHLIGSLCNTAAGMIAIDADTQGPCYGMVAGWATSACAIGRAYEWLRRGEVDIVVVGGSDSIGSPFVLSVLGHNARCAQRELDADAVCRPFDRQCRGTLPAEGAAVLVLETAESAARRGVCPYVELAGYGEAHAPSAADAASQAQSMARAMLRALAGANSQPTDVEYINASGSAVAADDCCETEAIKQVFADHAHRLWISGSKGSSGHLLGGSGAFETALTALALQRGVVPPTTNLQEPHSDLDYVEGAPRNRRCTIALSNSFGEGGHHASLLLRAIH